MEQTTTAPTAPASFDCVELLTAFVNQRPGLDPADYGGGADGWRIYRREAAEITRDRADFYDLLQAARNLYGREELNAAIIKQLTNTGDRLSLKIEEGKSPRLGYITGQYWPTEYRPAACRALVPLIWRKLRENAEKAATDPEKVTGHDIRKAARRYLRSRRTARNYFN